ncbi:MAG: DUF3037 domain-containing protein [Chitinophagaceae bacterium]|nr:MAG: DUF3037 domain-containing protein [Chitinophagaceae bacterium]
MPAPLLYEYAVVRVVPRVEREEFLNVGVILYCRQQKKILVRMSTDLARLRMLSAGTDTVEIQSYLEAFLGIALGRQGSGPIASLDAASRFRWLTAVRSTVVQTSRVHPGLCAEPAEAIEKLFLQLVG